MPIEQKHQLIDDEAVFKIQELEGLNKSHIQALNKAYHTLSIIGSQSSGKSTLLNALFGTTFQQLNRKNRVGQTTKGIWYSIDPKSSMMILDIEGSDSYEREQRTKVQRRNCLFALAVSHTLLINLWIQQIGLYKGSQLSILEIILQLNLRLFGSEQPKNILFVIRDFVKGNQNMEALKAKLFSKVEEAWNNIKKPPGKQHVQLSDLFKLQAYFLPSKLDEPEQFQEEVATLRTHLFQLASNQKVINKNVSMADFPQYMKNLWETITNDKDVNLPQQKILLSNMKCHQIKKQVYEAYQNQFRDQLQKSQRKMNIDFADNIKTIVNKMINRYDEETVNYHQEESSKVKEEFLIQLERKIQLSYSYQIKHIANQCLREFTDQVNKFFLKDKGIENIKTLKPQTEQKFAQYLRKVSYKQQWAENEIKKFQKTLQQTFQSQKQRIVVDSLKDFDRSIKKQIQNIVSNAFYDKKIFSQDFWGHLSRSFKEVEHKAKNSIVGLYKKLEFRPDEQKSNSLNKSINEHVERARNNASEELKTIIKMKSNDLLYYMMRHFSVDFNLDEEGIPRQWPNLKPEEITNLYEKIKQRYLDMIPNFAEFELNLDSQSDLKSSQKPSGPIRSTLGYASKGQNHELMNSTEMLSLRKKMEEMMNSEYQQALKKNKQVYMGAIPKWGWILFLIVALDDILLWMSSPALAIPLTIILVAIGGVFFFGGSSFAGSLVNNARRAASNQFGNLAAQATTRMMRNN